MLRRFIPAWVGRRSPRDAAAGDAVAGVLLGTLGTSADGAVGVRSAVPLVRRARYDDPVWDHSTFSKNRDRLLDGEIAAKFLSAVLAQPRVKQLLSSDHFSVDGTLIEAWASMKSFKPKKPSDAGGTGAAGVMRRPISGARSAPTRRTAAQPTRTPGSTARGRGWRPSFASSAMG